MQAGLSRATSNVALATQTMRQEDYDAIVGYPFRNEAIPGFTMQPSFRESQRQEVMAALDFLAEL
jgi:hypothetical protein